MNPIFLGPQAQAPTQAFEQQTTAKPTRTKTANNIEKSDYPNRRPPGAGGEGLTSQSSSSGGMPAAPKPPADSQAGQQAPLYATKKANKLNPKYNIPGVKIAASRKPRGIKKAKDDVNNILETQQGAAPKPTKVTPTTITETAHKRQQAEEITGTATKKPRMVAVPWWITLQR